MGKNRFTSKDAAETIRKFLDGTCGPYDWDDFISVSFKDPYVEEIRKRCNKVDEDYPPRHKNEWCNDEGAKVLEGIAREIEARNRLLGKWELEPTGKPNFEPSSMFIFDDGKLVYVIHQADRDQAVLLNYKIEGHFIVSDQPSHPKEERSRFEFLDDQQLRVENDGESGVWKKAEMTEADTKWKRYYMKSAPRQNMKWRNLFLVVVLLLSCWLIYQWIGVRKGPLYNFVYDQMDAAIDKVNKSGQDADLEFDIPSDATVVICPPYTSPSLFENPFSGEVIKELDKQCLMGAETGHMMYVLNGQVIDHQLLGGLAEPIIGWGNGPTVKINISKKVTSARPVRIQIINAAPLVLKPENEKFRADLVLPGGDTH